MKNRLKIAVVLAAAALAVTGCSGGGSGSGSSSSSGSDDANVAWVDKVCSASLNAVKSLSTEPQLDMSDPAKLKTGFSEWLGNGSASVDKSIKELEGLKNGPHPDSEKLVNSATEVFGKIKTALDDAKKAIDAADPNDPAAIAEAFSKVGTQLSEFAKVGTDFQDTFVQSNLAEAEKKAKNCQELNKTDTTSSAPTS
ncbi:hypothetical protein Lesp02_51460 [Lentzea sp. NBRC 105346]|uniref:hypothetical protein n=1 Tax=Lentzea sp. NBRC 105346 TaxID=3032205 RepID=UPI00249FD7CD|nr:hypothetical protein [Lentzea sp. NBRC 105346]GLZ32958.1 hypothetical protein Lesp02_51460 [Lentzea sp. NBRC 105346]